MRTFLFSDEKSNKFWNIDLRGASFTVTFGKVGGKGQTQTKDFPDAPTARKAHDKLVAEKLAKGYLETTPRPTHAPTPLQEALEQALVENPDDLVTHSAYADYLTEHEDPRGELIQVQLALEDPARSAPERTRLRQRESDLLKQHARQWLGDVGRFLVGEWSGSDKPYHYAFARGWLDFVRVLPFPDAIIASLARSPEARLLRQLEVVYDMRYHPFEFDQFVEGPIQALIDDEELDDEELDDEKLADTWEPKDILPPLLASRHLSNLRVFKLGFSDSGDPYERGHPYAHSTMVRPFGTCNAQAVIDLLQKCPRLEELYLNTNLPGIENLFALRKLGNLRVLQYYYGTDRRYRNLGVVYPLTALANNASLQRLTTLRLHPGRDVEIPLEEMAAVLHSPHLPHLIHLQVHVTTFGDEGCRHVVESGALRRLKTLDLGYGTMTDEGARMLAACADLKHLDVLDLTGNALTEQGIAALKATGIQVIADKQHDPEDEEYFYDCDFE